MWTYVIRNGKWWVVLEQMCGRIRVVFLEDLPNRSGWERHKERIAARRPFTRPLWLPKRGAQKPKWERSNGNGQKRSNKKILREVDIAGLERQSTNEQSLQCAPSVTGQAPLSIFRSSRRFGSIQRSLTPVKIKSAVYVLKEENQTPKKEINLPLTESLNSIQMWQRMKNHKPCV